MSIKAIAYDFEVFKYNWCVTFQDLETNEITVIADNLPELKKYYQNNILGSILVGYNNGRYDDHILRGLLEGADPYVLSQWLIVQKMPPWLFPALQYKKNNIVSYDVMSEIGGGIPTSLKHVEGFLGKKIYECDIPFDLNRPLTADEMARVIDYNKYDLEMTALLFNKFKGRYDSQLMVVEMFDLPLNKLIKTSAGKAALILNAVKIPKYETFNYSFPEKIKHLFNVADPIVEKFVGTTYVTDIEERKKTPFGFQHNMRDFPLDFALGGLHGAKKAYQYMGEIWNLDVVSYYVSLMIEFNFFSRASSGGLKRMKELIQLRNHYKAIGDKPKADALKLIIVIVYGTHGYDNSPLWDAEQQINICITGQLLLYLLQSRLEPYAEIIQNNTDGVMIIPINKPKCIEIYKQWELDVGMQLELTTGKRIIQKDVNNYIFVTEDDKIKVKGKDVKCWETRISDETFDATKSSGITNNYTIVDEAVVKYFLYNTPVEQTITANHPAVKYQYIVKLKSGFKNLTNKLADGSFEKITNKNILNLPVDYDPNAEASSKIYRLFAVTKDGYDLHKHKVLEDGTAKNDKIANSSNCMVIDNSEIIKLNNYAIINLDYNYYINLAKKAIELYETIK